MSSSGGVTAVGKKNTRNHLKEDKKLLKDRIKLEKKQQKIDAKHSVDHKASQKQSKNKEKVLKKQLATKGKGSSGAKTAISALTGGS